jgi:ribosomal protein L16/L10AE
MALDIGSKESSGRKAKRTTFFCCTVPRHSCAGSAHTDEKFKFHSSIEEVRRCQENYLKKQGFIKIGNRMMQGPDGWIRVLTKKPLRAKPGKGDRYMARMPQTGRIVPW